MSVLLPSRQAERIRSSLVDYLTTTFALADSDARRSLAEFLTDPATSMFKGPYIRTRLPFAPAPAGWESLLSWELPYPPYRHQAEAFARLRSVDERGERRRPSPTLITTGTGSGKTESFLFPILDHVIRARRSGVEGVKALILYPMNALANDQAGRIAQIITSRPELAGVTAALYTGQDKINRTKVSAEGLITDRGVIRDSPPDILLTNYKMLDQLLLRHEDANLWKQSASSLQYLVLDEFHTYDGAQGTDVAMLLRRLGLTLKAWEAPEGDESRQRPLGAITPVATSATLGDDNDPSAMIDFASTVFGEQFDASMVVGESRLSLEQWAGESAARCATEGLVASDLARLDLHALVDSLDSLDGVEAVTTSLLRALWGGVTGEVTEPGRALDLVRAHPLVHALVDATVEAAHESDLVERILPSTVDAEVGQRFLVHLLTVLSHVRARHGLEALSVTMHLWVRELTRIDRTAEATASYRWGDDGVTVGDAELEALAPAFPAVYCRHCGRSGWGVSLAPTGNDLDTDDTGIRRQHAARQGRFRALLYAPGEADRAVLGEEAGPQVGPLEGLQWFHTRQRTLLPSPPPDDHPDMRQGQILPVLTQVGADADTLAKHDTCPSCQQRDGIRFLGSAIATLLSVTLSTLFGDHELDASEKKALVFTDSVQDAAHRAGFVEARSHTLTLRAVLRAALGDTPKTLEELVDEALRRASDDRFARYRLLPPALAGRDEFEKFWSAETLAGVPAGVRTRVRRRLLFDAGLEVGLQSRIGRTLEATGAIAVHVEAGDAARLAAIARRVVRETAGQDTLDEHLANIDDSALTAWARGVLERIRERGGIYHEWLQGYLKSDGSRYRIWGGRPKNQGMPAFPPGRSAPAFPRIGAGTPGKDPLLDPVTHAQSWYTRWTARVLGVQTGYAGLLAKQLLAALAQGDVLRAHSADGGATIYSIPPDAVVVHPVETDALAAGDHLLVCAVCRHQLPGTREVVDQLDGAPCVLGRCPGTMRRSGQADNFYRRLYASTDMRRIVAREHSGLLDDLTRLEYETAFKSATNRPEAPNVLVATPTLEMGIDIGDLSTVVLASLPRTVASYVQRVGRAGRLTGNALNLAFVTGRGEHLPRIGDPLSVINGQVRPPATYLSAEEILRRQYIAHLVDAFARDPQRPHPAKATAALGSTEKGSFLSELTAFAETEAESLLESFLKVFGGVDEDVAELLRAWATPGDGAGSSGLALHLQDASARWKGTLEDLKHRLLEIENVLPELRKVAALPAANDDDKAAAKSAEGTRRLFKAQSAALRGEHWIAVLESFGVLPNYTLIDDAVTLDVDLTWVDPDTGEYQSEEHSYQRGASLALRELAPGAVFYARGTQIEIDSVDLGPDAHDVRTWAFCRTCGFGHEVTPTAPTPSTCPRCGGQGIADTGQRFRVIELTRVSATVRRDEAAIDDSSDQRRHARFSLIATADIDPAAVTDAWFVDGLDFGVTYLRQLEVRWLNTGAQGGQATNGMIAGTTGPVTGFRLCSACGHLDKATGQNSAREHKAWCRYRKSTDEHTIDVLLSRTLRTEGLVIRLPDVVTSADSFAEPSLRAALLLGLREAFGGAPDHIDVAAIAKPVSATGAGGTTARALLLHDTVPGGTGYLAGLARAEGLWDVLQHAWRVVSQCPCAGEERLACHRCLLPFAAGNPDAVSRQSAERHLAAILAGGIEAPAGTDVSELERWEVTREEPPQVGSPLEVRFRGAFESRVKAAGATIKAIPGHHGNTLKITFQGAIRRWSFTPEVSLGGVQPDFVLKSDDPNIPPVAIFCDGWQFHASPAHNRIAEDAEKRAILRDKGYVVLSVTAADLDPDTGTPFWLDSETTNHVLQAGYAFSPALVSSTGAGVLDTLMSWIQQPDLTGHRGLAEALPWYFMPSGQRIACGDESLQRVAARILTAPNHAPEVGEDGWYWREGSLVVVARIAAVTSPPAIEFTAMLDDRAAALATEGHLEAWRRWLQVLNAVNLRETLGTVTALSLAGDEMPEQGVRGGGADLSYGWRAVIEYAQNDEEAHLMRDLAQAGLPTPVVGAEVEDGIPIDLSWPDHKIALEAGLDLATRDDLVRAGWVVAQGAREVLAALKTTNAPGAVEDA